MVLINKPPGQSYLSYQAQEEELLFEVLNTELVLSASGIEVWIYGSELPEVASIDLELLRLVVPQHNNLCLEFAPELGAIDLPHEMAVVVYLKRWGWLSDPHEVETLKLDPKMLKALNLNARSGSIQEGRV